ncbi:aminotransferase class IV [Staphylococcus caledonicus]|uniref:aminotransferase class IV n=1 Tax=Staphylococcus caledonicus TaxID=2741333 RepID=UPI0018E40012|nr:aminotransferase class IV [Staphylococcus caledonicus]MBI5971772.1 aminotransferase class IV [Staphylococcus caledonicus]
MELFETMRLDHGVIPRFEYHTKRLQRSSQRLGYSFSKEQWVQYVEQLKHHYSDEIYRLKVILDDNGNFTHVIKPLPEKTNFTAKLKLMDTTCPQSFIINKTSERQHLEHNHVTDLVLLYNNEGKILEFDIGNIMIEEQGHYYTPSYQHDFLLGCMRESLIEQGKLEIKDYSKDELIEKLKKGEIQVYLLNSLREVADVAIYL